MSETSTPAATRLSLASSARSGALSWQGTHQDAQTLTTLIFPLNIAGSSPGTCAPSLTKPIECRQHCLWRRATDQSRGNF
jgi:hypothetical protein